MSTANAASLGTQEDICALVFTRLIEGSERPRQIVITGVAGVGKSAVTRTLAWRLGCYYLAQPGGVTPFPVYLPLQQVTPTGGTGLRATLGCALGLVDGAGRPR